MTRLLAVCLLVLSTSAYAQTGGSPAATAPGTPKAQAEAAPPTNADRERLRQEVMEDVRKQLDREREQLRDEIRAQIVAQSANLTLEEEFQFTEEKRRLELFTIDGYYRLRPELFYKFDLGRGNGRTDFPAAAMLFPRPTFAGTHTSADANMRWRLEPTLNVSEDIRIRSQIDVFDRLILGATPQGNFGITDYNPVAVGSTSQVPTQSGRNFLTDSITVKRVYGEVTTPVGQLLFGRMGSQWGLGMLTNSGNCIDCDYGDTVDRIAFVSSKIADHYIVPMIDFVSEGPTTVRTNEYFGQPADLDQLDDARDYGLAIAKRDTDLELSRKLGAGQHVINYGLYFIYRTQRWDTTNFTNPAQGIEGNPTLTYVPREANLYVPDLWFKYQTPKLRLEFEIAGVFGKIGTMQSAPGSDPSGVAESVTLTQVGAVAQGEYKVLDALGLNLELGYASGDSAYGMGNYPGRGVARPGSVEGSQFCIADPATGLTCPRGIDRTINNFRFNRDYRVDLILWREIFQGITDAVYIKPGVKYELTEGLGLWANIVYSRAVEAISTPSSRSAQLGIELDGGLRYESGDGFMAGLAYGVLFPLAGLDYVTIDNGGQENRTTAGTAQTVRGWFVIKY